MFFDCAASGAPVSFISELQRRFPYLPSGYIDLLREYDGLDIAWFVFQGSGDSKYPPLQRLLDRDDPRIDVENCCPFATDASGNVLTINRNGSIEVILTDSASENSTLFLARDFETLMDKGFFGPDFTKILYGRPPRPDDDLGWVSYLKKAGWF